MATLGFLVTNFPSRKYILSEKEELIVFLCRAEREESFVLYSPERNSSDDVVYFIRFLLYDRKTVS